MKKPEPKKKVEVATKEKIEDFPAMPAYLEKVIANMPQGGDNSIVYAGGYGWVCEYVDGSKELLEELPGLLSTLRRHGRNKFGRPFEVGAVLSTNITVETLNLLAVNDLKLLGQPLGIESDNRIDLIAQLIEKLQIK